MMYQRTDLTLSMFYASSGDGYPLTISGVWRIYRQLLAGTNT